MTAKKVLYVISQAPYSNASGVEALDAIFIGGLLELNVSVLFLHDGVFQVKQDQDATLSGVKQVTKAFNALEDYDVTSIYAQDLSMAARGLVVDDLALPVTIIDSPEVAQLISEQDKVFTF